MSISLLFDDKIVAVECPETLKLRDNSWVGKCR